MSEFDTGLLSRTESVTAATQNIASERQLRIFLICHRVPFPPDRGDRIATFNLVRHLGQKHEVHVFCLGDGPTDAAGVAALRGFARTVTAAPRSKIGEKIRGMKALFTQTPLSVAFANERQLHEAIEATSRAFPPDLVIVYSSEMAQFATKIPHASRIMNFSDLDSQKWSSYGKSRAFPLNRIYRREAALLLAHERRIAETFSHSLVCTQAEKQDFEKLIPGQPVSVLSNGVDLEHFCSRHVPKRSGMMIFTGVMDYFPNVDATRWFCDQILPRVRERVPYATFVICGKSPTAAVKRLATQPGVEVTGEVPDVRPYLDTAEICVVPMRIARGIQNKLLEGLAMGLPCISSRCSWNGTVIEEGDGVLVADDPDEFAEHAVRLLQDEPYRDQLGRRARASVENHYAWDQQLRQLDRIIRHLC